jgi:hypothetical protein
MSCRCRGLCICLVSPSRWDVADYLSFLLVAAGIGAGIAALVVK